MNTSDMPWGMTDTAFLVEGGTTGESEPTNSLETVKPKAMRDTARLSSWGCIDVMDMIAGDEDETEANETIMKKLESLTVSPRSPSKAQDGSAKSASPTARKGERLQLNLKKIDRGERRRPILNIQAQQRRHQELP
ncbi:expressed unknown protein [Seminavis robusta]|uniref:Uncharacterized protein n=1 Tax=Seminavis robusta TaxID=568900 RepID=A0A9N8H9L2_9STRA|nr:expressed unknown protein [Seminavis robusta]|eukprot:Sro120_g058620.1 n/a (136) ;mRNA; r:85804-86211